MSTPASQPTPPWDATEPLPPATDETQPLPPVDGRTRPLPAASREDDDATQPIPSASEATRALPSSTEGTRPLPPASDGTRPLPPVGGAGYGALRGAQSPPHTRVPGAPMSATQAPAAQAPRAQQALRGVGASTASAGRDLAPGTGDGAVREWRMLSPKTLIFGGLDLVVDAVLNFALLTLIGAMVVAGVMTLPVLGLGVLVLAATVYVMVAAVWLERRRSASSFGLDIRDPRRRRSPRSDWLRIPHHVWLDLSDGPLWLGMLHLVLTCALGWVALLPWLVVGAGIAGMLAPIFMPSDSVVVHGLERAGNLPVWTLVVGAVLAVVLSILLGVLVTLAHRGLSAGLLRQSEAVRLRREAAESRRRAEYESAAKEAAVRGSETERSRIERDLHDGVQPQLVSVAMNLSMAKSKIDTDPAAAKELVAEAHGTTKAAITELRRLARGFHPAVLEDRGLDAALSAVAAQAPFPVDVAVTVPRLEPRTEAAVYFAVSESLTNAVKHSGARSAEVAVSLQDGPVPGTTVVVAGVRDTGRGGARVVPGGGLSGIQDRIRSAGGRFFVNSPVGGPTEVVVELPLGSAAGPGTTTPRGGSSTPRTTAAEHDPEGRAPGTQREDGPRAHSGPGRTTGGPASSYPGAGEEN